MLFCRCKQRDINDLRRFGPTFSVVLPALCPGLAVLPPPLHPLGFNDIFSSFAALPPHRRLPGVQTLPPALPLVPGRQPRAGQSRGAAGCMSSPPPDVAQPKPPDDFPIGTVRRDAGTSGQHYSVVPFVPLVPTPESRRKLRFSCQK